MTRTTLTAEQLLASSAHPSPKYETARGEYTKRAFTQDAELAIKNDFYRALIEAVTNCDDNYGDRPGEISIKIWGANPWFFSVRDQGTGIARNEFKPRLIDLGNRTSGAEEGKSTRGNRGRGAKDLASLGVVRYESIRNNHYAEFAMDRTGDAKISPTAALATNEIRERLGIRKNGTLVTVGCRSAKKPRYEAAKKKICNLVALRDILCNPKRTVLLAFGEEESVRLQFKPPADRREILREQLVIKGYPAKATLVLFEHSAPLEEPPKDECRIGGVLIKSGRSIHEATLFGLEGNPYAQRLSGELQWKTIDELAKEYDDREQAQLQPLPANPLPIIGRSREGLEQKHPASVALRDATEPVLRREAARIEAQTKNRPAQETAETRRILSQLGSVLSAYWKEKRQELESEDAGTEESEDNQKHFSVIPPKKRIDPGETATFTVQLVQDLDENGLPGDLEPEARVSLIECKLPAKVKLSVTRVRLKPDDAMPGRFRGTFKVESGDGSGEALIDIRYGDESAGLELTIEPAQAITIPSTLTFSSEHYTVRPGKAKTLTITAPTWLVDENGAEVAIRSSNSISVRPKSTALRLRLRPDELFYQGTATVYGDKVGERAKVSATGGRVVAVTRVAVAEEDKSPHFEVEIDAVAGYQRAQIKHSDNGDVKIIINGLHPAATRYFGPHPEYVLQGTALSKLLMAEIAGEETVQYFLNEKYKNVKAEVLTLQVVRNRELARILPKIHAVMLKDNDVEKGILANQSTVD